MTTALRQRIVMAHKVWHVFLGARNVRPSSYIEDSRVSLRWMSVFGLQVPYSCMLPLLHIYAQSDREQKRHLKNVFHFHDAHRSSFPPFLFLQMGTLTGQILELPWDHALCTHSQCLTPGYLRYSDGVEGKGQLDKNTVGRHNSVSYHNLQYLVVWTFVELKYFALVVVCVPV